MKKIVLVAAVMLAGRVLAADPPDLTPPPPPEILNDGMKTQEWMRQQQEDEFQIMTVKDLDEHPRAVPNEKTPPDVRAEYTRRLNANLAKLQALRDSWHSKPALDKVIGKDQSVENQRKCVSAVIRYHLDLNLPDTDKAMNEWFMQKAMKSLTEACPNVPPEKLATLLKQKPWDLCTMPPPKNPQNYPKP